MGKQTFLRSMTTLAAVSMAFFGSLMGCASDDYYCDSNGCYYCDGVGCRAVTPPSRPMCLGDYQCPSNQVCTTLGCTASCANSNDCAQGWICRGASGTTRGVCVAPTETTPTRTPGACGTNADCMGGAVCVNGVCARPVCDGGTTSCVCASDAQCTAPQTCVAGRCTAPSNVCQFNSQCGAGRVCINQQCQAACSASSPCPTGQVCTNGICQDHPAGQCTRDADCPANNRCVNTTCLPRCTANTDCASGLYCNDQGVCAPDTRRRPFCTSDADCASGSQCLDGVCRRPCTAVDECQRTAVNYRNCAPIAYLRTTRSYCQTDSEYRPNCARAADCTAGQACVDAVCRTP